MRAMNSSDGGGELINSQYDWSTNRPSVAVVTAIAALENVEPVDLPVTLYDHISPEALDALVATNSPVTISFHLEEYYIQIDRNSLVITDN
jgi:hypothetical protein